MNGEAGKSIDIGLNKGVAVDGDGKGIHITRPNGNGFI